jgi:hypothetical protein
VFAASSFYSMFKADHSDCQLTAIRLDGQKDRRSSQREVSSTPGHYARETDLR